MEFKIKSSVGFWVNIWGNTKLPYLQRIERATLLEKDEAQGVSEKLLINATGIKQM